MEPMKQSTMESVVKALSTKHKGGEGYLAFTYNNLSMYLISDTKHNRMRIVAPVIEYDSLSTDQIESTLIANFHLTLDARYAISDGMLYSAFIHPMAELTQVQIESAVAQVANLVFNFGNSYSSGELTFGDILHEKKTKH